MFEQQNKPFIFFSVAVLLALPFHLLIQDGMFMDAVHYTCVARNLADGFGTFWFPHFSKLDLVIPGVHAFHEQPPLVFGIQAMFFKMLGQSLYVERIYVAITVLLSAYLIKALWQACFSRGNEHRKLFWLPVLLWITSPIVYWGGSNNVLENTLGLFALVSVLISWQLLRKSSGNVLMWMLAGAGIFLAVFSKGFPGLFPLAVPFLYWLCFRKQPFSRMLLQTFYLCLSFSVLLGILLLIPEGRESLSVYFFKRVLYRITEATTSEHRWETLQFLLQDAAPMAGALLLVWLIRRFSKVQVNMREYARQALFFILVGLSASLPLMMTMIQKPFYVLPAYPYFAIGIALLMLPAVSAWIRKINVQRSGFKLWRIVSLILLLSAPVFIALQYGKTKREKDVLHDVHVMGAVVGEGNDLSTGGNTFFEVWVLQCYIMRYYKISMDFRQDHPHKYFVKEKDKDSEFDFSGYSKVDTPLYRYELYMQNDTP